MGPGLLRRFVSFDPLIDPDQLPDIKAAAQDVEAIYQWVEGGKRGRRVNIDPGYLEANMVVLASKKVPPTVSSYALESSARRL